MSDDGYAGAAEQPRAPRPIRILYFTTSLNTRGPARALVNLASRLDRRRFDPLFCQCDPLGPGDAVDRLAAARIPVHTLDVRGTFDIRNLWRLSRLLRAERVDVLHTRLTRADFFGRVAGRLTGVPLIITNVCDIYSQHFSSWHGAWKGTVIHRMDRMTLGLSHLIVANADGVRADLLSMGLPAKRVRRIYNGVDTTTYAADPERGRVIRRRLGLAPDDWVIGTVARLSPKKGLTWLLDALPLVLRGAPNVRVLIVGDGPEHATLESQIARHGLGARVTLLGDRTDVPDLLCAMDVFAFPSFFEGHPNAVIEAMATELPVVAFDSPGINEVVVDHLTGRVVSARNVQDLAAALLEFKDAAAGRRCGLAGRRTVVERFSLDRMSAQFTELYEEALARTGRHLPAFVGGASQAV